MKIASQTETEFTRRSLRHDSVSLPDGYLHDPHVRAATVTWIFLQPNCRFALPYTKEIS